MANPNRLRGLDAGERAALIISECQTAIVDPAVAMFKSLADAVAEQNVLPAIRELAGACRASALPVIHCIVRLLPEGRGFRTPSPLHAIMRRNALLATDRPESNIHPLLVPHPGDIVSERHFGITGFHGTELDTLLRGLDVQTVILTGVSTNIALVGMGIEAVNRGFNVVIPADCTAGGSPETHRHALTETLPILGTVTTSAAIIACIGRRDVASGAQTD